MHVLELPTAEGRRGEAFRDGIKERYSGTVPQGVLDRCYAAIEEICERFPLEPVLNVQIEGVKLESHQLASIRLKLRGDFGNCLYVKALDLRRTLVVTTVHKILAEHGFDTLGNRILPHAGRSGRHDEVLHQSDGR